MDSLLIKIAKGQPITEKEIENALYDVCDNVHGSCDCQCPVYSLNGNKVPDTANEYRVNRGCDCFKSGKQMLKFIREH